ncbi:choloylglycine hydrolase family protein [Staphylococcus simiae]|uniref:Penicillin-related choloylglycine hydrolase n=1 Tax=Staphylococcus simiae CCM 7213 = CCUG 51256 TaxID=911238 RepID=G5JF37_9STAP|nr:choloylglycine hydrolase family protein [Staphylococcus simiae]EHJ09201.1 penicillin-related choloylglycine hydrolase [Staphylococcus simiae CCM 7213 = CCUG 51256]PNZ13895.1 linear amide C-N hydrolase [Staphylococcus simiae]SNV59329.1 choloylglycine hydrolase [Staphylococcus simiae]
MCTGYTITTQNGQVILGRTMDYDYPLDGYPAVTPRHYHWTSRTGTTGQTKYGFIGTGSDMEGFIYGDGVNEHGVALSTQYFRGFSSYATEHKDQAMNITQNEIVTWILGYTTSIEDLKQQASTINVVAIVLNDIGEVPPLHYHVSDATGQSVEVSFDEGRVVVTDNPLGVLTNHPDLAWHYNHLRQYANISPYTADNFNFDGVTIEHLGNESGTYGLPGGFTSSERFVRMAFLKANIDQTNDQALDILNAFKLLDAVSIPKGIVRPADADSHYTMYQTVLNLTHPSVYVKYYNSNAITQLMLTEELISRQEMTIYDIKPQMSIQQLND